MTAPQQKVKYLVMAPSFKHYQDWCLFHNPKVDPRLEAVFLADATSILGVRFSGSIPPDPELHIISFYGDKPQKREILNALAARGYDLSLREEQD